MLRRGPASAWASLNPVLYQGEPGFEIDTFNLKVGDGVTPWNSLPYVNAAANGAFSSGVGSPAFTPAGMAFYEDTSGPHYWVYSPTNGWKMIS